jgi:7-carboxy-7-deazaguanine synthase
MNSYTINEIFYSIQGEGVRAGTANFFVRFTGCNQTCRVESHGFDCDTEFVSGRKMTPDEISWECRRLNEKCRWIILTGGEPALQVDRPLIAYLHSVGFKLAIETNGSVNLPKHNDKITKPDATNEMIDWVTVSPKVAEHAVRQLFAHELKYVRGHGQGIPRPTCQSPHKLISPAFNGNQIDPDTLSWCIQLIKENPDWRLSLQLHKFIGVR